MLANAERTVRSTWDAIIPGSFAEFGEHTELLFYDRAAGQGEFYATDGHGGWRRGGTCLGGRRGTRTRGLSEGAPHHRLMGMGQGLPCDSVSRSRA